MQLKTITFQSFFRQPSPTQVKLLKHSKRLLQAFFSETHQGPFFNKIVLTDQYLAVLSKKQLQYEPILILQITENLKFHFLQKSTSIKSETSPLNVFSLINNSGETVDIYLQFSSLFQLWIRQLSKTINQIRFGEQFKVIERIGKGSTSSVYKVQRIEDGQIFAAKSFSKTFLQGKSLRKQSVNNEISLLRALDHKNILKIYSVFEQQGAICIITQFLEGGTLLERINQSKGFKLPQIKHIMKDILQGLNYIHRFELMHRDIKMQNIMFRSKHSLEIVIVDFGLAAISEDQPYINYRCGTPGFIAPEIIGMKTNRRIDVVCDIFSAGVIMHVLLTNKYLFAGKDLHQIYSLNKSMEFNLESQKYSIYNKEGLRLMGSMLEVEWEDRISAQEALGHQFFNDLKSEYSDEKATVSPAFTMAGEQCYLL